jgi:hypothetical protein
MAPALSPPGPAQPLAGEEPARRRMRPRKALNRWAFRVFPSDPDRVGSYRTSAGQALDILNIGIRIEVKTGSPSPGFGECGGMMGARGMGSRFPDRMGSGRRLNPGGRADC